VKRLRRTRDRHVVELLPENPDFEPIRVDLSNREFALEGIAVGVLRV
jgi:repressor LexA